MKQQLYINNTAVDMPSEAVKIKIESNILSDVDKVRTAHSYNITLPRTMTNDAVFAMAFLPASETGGVSTHRYLSASLWVDGVPVFNNGNAVLTSVDDKGYNLNLYWGIVGAFDEIKREGLYLCDLPMSAHWGGESASDWTVLAKTPISLWDYKTGMDADVYATLNDKSKAEVDELPWVMPVTSAADILSKVQSVYGITFSYSQRFSQRLQLLWHPLVTRRAMCDDEQVTFTLFAVNRIWNNKYFMSWNNQFAYESSSRLRANAVRLKDIGGTYYDCVANREIVVKSVHVYGYCNADFHAVFPDAKKGEVHIDATQQSATRYTIDYTWTDVKVGEESPLPGIVTYEDTTGASSAYTTDIRMDVVIDDIGELKIGDNWSYVRNYPKLKVLDYLSEIMAHTGAFIVGSVSEPTALRIVTFDEVAEANPVAVDDGKMQAVESITMSLDDLAQRNNYLHDNNDDDGLEYDASGVIYTNDATLKLDRDAFKSNFKVPRNDFVKLFDVELDESGDKYNAKWDVDGMYIGGFINGASTPLFANTGQDFTTIIDEYMSNYEAIVRRPKEVVVTLRLNILELLGINFERPLYIAQLGRIYLIESVESDNDDNYRLTLIQK